MPNDFEPVVGQALHLQDRPIGDWDGVRAVRGAGSRAAEPAGLFVEGRLTRFQLQDYGSRLDSVVTWTLAARGSGTRLRMVQAGFRSPQNDFAYDAMSSGWGRIVGRIGEIWRRC